jgi:signal transduction histidine kinase/ligand-binding sensor domain-containing protein
MDSPPRSRQTIFARHSGFARMPLEMIVIPKRCWMFAATWLLLGGVCVGLSASGARLAVDGHWGTDEGSSLLPQGSVISMIQTRDGYLWLGTLGGLVRFDGLRFTVFDESNTPGLSSSRVVKLFEDSQDNLWVGTETAGVFLVRANGQISSIDVGRGTREGRLMSVCEDINGSVWLYTARGELCRYRDGTIDVWLAGAGESRVTRVIIPGEGGLLWVGNDWNLSALGPIPSGSSLGLPVAHEIPITRLDFLLASDQGGYWRLANGRVQKWKGNRMVGDFGPYPWDPARTPVFSACEDRQGNLIVGTGGEGVFWFDADGKATQITSATHGLAHNTILSLCTDREGSLWVGTDGGGLNRVKQQTFDVVEESRPNTVQSVSEDAQGGLWIGFFGDGALHWKDGRSQRVTNVHPREGSGPSPPTYVRAMFVDRDQTVWASIEQRGLFQVQNGEFWPAPGADQLPRQIWAIHQDRAGKLWLGTSAGLAARDGTRWRLFTTRDGLAANDVRAIADSADGLWVGTEGGGLHRFQNGKFTAVQNAAGETATDVSSLLVDADGVLWIGTRGSGLLRFHEDRWTRYTSADGLGSDRIGYMVEDPLGHLWLGSYAGLIRVAKQQLNDPAAGVPGSIRSRTYGRPDGLPTRECTQGSQPAAIRTRNGKLWFPTTRGLASVDPAQIKVNTNLPPVIIESVLIEGRQQNTNRLRGALPEAIVVPAGRERLEIRYTSLNLGAPERARFKYRMEGHETDWIPAGDERIARYIKLPPGQYGFRVIAANEDDVWNEAGATIAFTVEPPFWRTWWFLGAATLALLAAIIGVVHYVSTQRLQRQLAALRQKEALEKERARIARDIHDQVGASLTQVSLLGELVESDKDSPQEVEAHAKQICQTALETTRALDEIVWTVNPSNDTLDGLINYICKNAQDYLEVAGLRYRLETPPQLPGAPISPEVRHNVFLAAKEAVTNVVRHAQATTVKIRLQINSNFFTLEIEDDGRGMGGMDPQAAARRNGLRNMRKRMEDVGGAFAMDPGAEAGTRITLKAPFGNQ